VTRSVRRLTQELRLPALCERPTKMGAHVEERVASIFEDIDPEASPHEYSVKAAQGRMTSGDQSVEDIW
jgi:hypothetical protein